MSILSPQDCLEIKKTATRASFFSGEVAHTAGVKKDSQVIFFKKKKTVAGYHMDEKSRFRVLYNSE